MKIVTGEELESMKLRGEKLLVDFFADWCGPCRMLAPRLENMESTYPDVTFVKVNIDQNREYVADMGIRSVPTVMFFDGSRSLNTLVGVQSDANYKENLQSLG